MALTLTSTAYSAEPKEIVAGVNSVSFDYTGAAGVTFSASANATVILGPKIPSGSTILSIQGSHSSGADSCPVDIGLDDSLSRFSSQATQGVNAISAKTTLPFKVSVTDTSASLYGVVKFGVDPETDTAAIRLNYTVFFTRDA